MRGEYNGLTGTEILDALLLGLKEHLSKDGRLSYSQAYHNVVLRGRFELESYPHEPPIEKFRIAVGVGSKAPEGAKKKVEKVIYEEKHDIPDLTREKLKESEKQDVDLLTNNEARGF